MDELSRLAALWQFKAFGYLACGLIVAILILSVSKKRLARMGQKPYRSPNWITLWGLLAYWTGFAILIYASRFMGCEHGLAILIHAGQFLGFQLGLAGAVLDVTDGKMSVAMREEGVARSACDVKIGESLDPLADKLKYLPTAVCFAIYGILDLRLVVCIVAVDAFGTALRLVSQWVERKPGETSMLGLELWLYERSLGKLLVRLDSSALAAASALVKRKFASRMRPSRATAPGKIKALAQALGLVACLPYMFGWINGRPEIPNWMFVCALAFGVISVATRLRFGNSFDKTMDFVGGSLFGHKDF